MTLKDIDLEIVNPFLIAAYDVFKKLFSVEIRKGAVILKENPTASYEIAIIIGVSGHKYTGVVVYSMKKSTAINLINSFDSDFKVDSADETFPDALGEARVPWRSCPEAICRRHRGMRPTCLWRRARCRAWAVAPCRSGPRMPRPRSATPLRESLLFG